MTGMSEVTYGKIPFPVFDNLFIDCVCVKMFELNETQQE